MKPARKPNNDELVALAVAVLGGERIVYDFGKDIYTVYNCIAEDTVFYDLGVDMVCYKSVSPERKYGHFKHKQKHKYIKE